MNIKQAFYQEMKKKEEYNRSRINYTRTMVKQNISQKKDSIYNARKHQRYSIKEESDKIKSIIHLNKVK